MALGAFLETHPKVKQVGYPGLKTDKRFNLSEKYFNGIPGTIMSFDLESKAACFEFMNRLQIIRRALEKPVTRRYRMGLDLASDLSMAFTHLERPQEDISIKEKLETSLQNFLNIPRSTKMPYLLTSSQEKINTCLRRLSNIIAST